MPVSRVLAGSPPALRPIADSTLPLAACTASGTFAVDPDAIIPTKSVAPMIRLSSKRERERAGEIAHLASQLSEATLRDRHGLGVLGLDVRRASHPAELRGSGSSERTLERIGHRAVDDGREGHHRDAAERATNVSSCLLHGVGGTEAVVALLEEAGVSWARRVPIANDVRHCAPFVQLQVRSRAIASVGYVRWLASFGEGR